MERGHGNEFFFQEGARHAHEDWWSGPLQLILLVLFIALVVAAAVWLVRRFFPAAATPAVAPAAAPAVAAGADPAVATLRMRYAKGEVSREEFQHTLADLTGAVEPWPGSTAGEETAPTAS